MASFARTTLPPPSSSSRNNNKTIITKISDSTVVQAGKRAAGSASEVGWKLAKSTGRAAWITGTTLLILIVPLILETERDAQLADLELQQASLLGAPAK